MVNLDKVLLNLLFIEFEDNKFTVSIIIFQNK